MVAAELPDRPVELEIHPGGGVEVARLEHGQNPLLQRGHELQVVLVGAGARQPQGQGFQGHPHLGDLLAVALAELENREAAVLRVSDQPFLRQNQQRLPNGAAAHVQLGCQIDFRKPLARVEVPREQSFAKNVGDVLAHRGGPQLGEGVSHARPFCRGEPRKINIGMYT